MPRMFSAVCLAALALLAGCATVPPAQRAAACAETDWHRYGVNDGRLGVPVSERTDAFEDCAELGHPADIAAYEAGRSEGLREYCTAETGFEVGYQGRRYEDVCPPELEPDFLQGLAQGRDERPDVGIYPSIGIGIGSGGWRYGGVGVGIGVGGFYHDGYRRDRWLRDPFPSSWRRGGSWGFPYGCGPFGRYSCW